MINIVLNHRKYNVLTELEEQRNLSLLYKYKQSVLSSNGFNHLIANLPNTSAQFTETKYDSEGLEEAIDISDIYPVAIEEEKNEILTRAKNLDYLRYTHQTFEHCRTRCKLTDQRFRNYNDFPKANQMCITDCLNIKFENSDVKKPNNVNNEKTFVWLS